ncbi:uncharacterized protein Z520_10470 [Fonsecaea multimorphosa CBS 102226]|uniref:FHA domain-containing protein n=1 Tax=Fonsecaea multimorphosa CBS 102226 TaxID=1442371 RepID=A0A0D2GW62_9EURO|nr:uncharacterized protein Z520_10470 [Fonsecaea multimorphosa CBS 102226]KIX93845.1 hypothetical protein Z520_10470 [Fonsecaea multimorphosa CBS 102226]OAL19084.1 hypothetical protein AYO22_10032 [Fonsecaea multimorphosa]
MWILDTNADFFQGRRMWLKPGQRYLFGRVKKDGVMIAIDHKTVSRQHFNITVDPVKDTDVGQIHTRTKIRIEDHSKTGTFVNGKLIKKKDPKNEQEPNPSRELNDAEISIRPGNCPYEFTLTWRPCVFTFNLLKKEIKSGVLKAKQARVQDLDIKAISDFSSEYTTHVVASKRNTAKGLLALVNAKYLVTESYLDALDYAATPITLSQEVNLSPLENDFDSAWPDPKDHLPPPGKEPTIRPAKSYQPDPARLNVFEHYTFVFGEQTQYDNLLPVVTSGHGKAILFKVVNFETTSDELIKFLQNAAGNKAGGNENGSKGGVILVRWSGKEDVQEWTNTLINETALKMDQRAIDQSEFLEAILANDAGLLKQPIPFESTSDGRIAPPPSAANSLATGQAPESRTNGDSTSNGAENGSLQAALAMKAADNAAASFQPSQTSGQDDSRVNDAGGSITKPLSVPKVSQLTKFKNFDDGFDPDAVAVYEDDEVIEEEAYVSGPETRSKSPVVVKQEPSATLRKRPRSPTEERPDTFAEEMDDLLPAATALKRRKLAEAAANGRIDEMDDIQPRPAPVRRIKKEREIDVREAARKQREVKEEAARREEEELEAVLPDIEDKEPANLVDVVTVDLPVRDKMKKANSRVNGDHGPDWDPRWNGRKNFKGFRRKGDPAQRRSHANKVIVQLVEVPNKTGGLGDQYWSKTEEEKERERERKRREEARNKRTTQSQTQPSSGTVGGRADGRSRTRIVLDDDDEEIDDVIEQAEEDAENASIARTTPGVSRLQREAEDIAEHEIDPDTPRRTRAADRTRQASENASETGGDDTTTARATTQSQKGKRAANSNAETSRPKRQKTLPVTTVRGDDSEDDDSDDMKFRFGTRARRGRGNGRGGRVGS